MPLTRLIPCLLLKDGLLVRSEEFSLHQVIGQPTAVVDRFTEWDCDELVILDITREPGSAAHRSDHAIEGATDTVAILKQIADHCFVPLTFGGGIRTVEDMGVRIANGADKVAINTAAVETPELITEGAEMFGSQAIVVSIDVKQQGGWWEAFTRGGRESTHRNAVELACMAERLGAGEIFLNSIDRDGMASGYDLPLVEAVSAAVGIPVVACGGVGKFEHLAEGIEAGASAVSAANIFHFTEHATQKAKKAMAEAGVDVRMAGVAV